MGVLEGLPRFADGLSIQAVTARVNEKLSQVKEKSKEVLSSAVVYADWSLPRRGQKYNSDCDHALRFFNNERFDSGARGAIVLFSIGDFINATCLPIQKSAVEGNITDREMIGQGELSVEVLINPSEIGRLHQAFTALSYQADVQYSTLQDLLEYQSSHHAEPSDVIALRWLTVLNTLGYTHSTQYQNLIAFLREHVIQRNGIKSWEQLTKKYWGRIIADRGFWQPSFKPVLVEMPDQAERIGKVRESNQQKEQIRAKTVFSTLKQTKIFNDEKAVSEYRNKPREIFRIQQRQQQIMAERVTVWRRIWQPVVAQIHFDGQEAFSGQDGAVTEELAHEANRFSKLLFEIVQLFFDLDEVSGVKRAEKSLSRKASRSFAGDSLKDEAVYESQLDSFILQAFARKDPAVMWLYGLRTPAMRQMIIQSIEQQPEQFEEFARLLVHELSRLGLLHRQGEVNLFFDEDQKISERFQERLPNFLTKIEKWGTMHSQLSKKTRSMGSLKFSQDKSGRAVFDLARMDLGLMFFLDEKSLAHQRRDICMEQIAIFMPQKLKKLSEAFVRLRLRSKQIFDRAFGTQIRQLKPDYLWKGIVYRFTTEQEIPAELKDRYAIRVGEVLGSSRHLSNLESLPFIAEQVDGGSGFEYLEKSTPPSSVFGVKSWEELQGFIKDDDDIALVFASLEPLALYGHEEFAFTQISKFQVQNADQSIESKVMVKAKAKKHTSVGVCESGLRAEKDYRLDEVVKIEPALAINQQLAAYPKLQTLHRLAIDLVNDAIGKNEKQQAEILTQIAQELVQFLQMNHYYDHPQQKPARNHALTWLAQNQRLGFECETSAWIVEDFFNSLGVPCVIINGHVPYFYQGGVYFNQSNGHAITGLLLPGGGVIDIDAALYTTPATPPWVREYQRSTVPDDDASAQVPMRLTEGTEAGRRRRREVALAPFSTSLKTVIALVMIGSAYSAFSGGGSERTVTELTTTNFSLKEWWSALEVFIQQLDFWQHTTTPETSWPSSVKMLIEQTEAVIKQLLTETTAWYNAHKATLFGSLAVTGAAVGTGSFLLRHIVRKRAQQAATDEDSELQQVAELKKVSVPEAANDTVKQIGLIENEKFIELAISLQKILPEVADEIQQLVGIDWEKVKPLIKLLIDAEQANILAIREVNWSNQQELLHFLTELTQQEAWSSFITEKQQTTQDTIVPVVLFLQNLKDAGESNPLTDNEKEMVAHLQQVGAALKGVSILEDTLHDYTAQSRILELLSANQQLEPKATPLSRLGSLAQSQLSQVQTKALMLAQMVDAIVGATLVPRDEVVPSK